MQSHKNRGLKIHYLIGPPRSGTNTAVSMLAEIPDCEGLHVRDAFYCHQGLIISPKAN